MERLDWDALHVFLEVQRSGSLAGAARELGINATTVGRRLAAFEQSIGAPLFTRSSDGLIATPAGDALIEHAEKMERSALLAHRLVVGDAAKLEGVVRLALSPNFAEHFLVPHLSEFHRRYPKISLRLMTATSYVDLTRGDADLAIRHSRPGQGVPVAAGQSEVRAQRVGMAGIGVYASKAYLDRVGAPDGLDDVSGWDLVTYAQDVAYLPGHSWLERVQARNRVVLRADDVSTMAAAIRAGFGLGPLPCFVAINFPEIVPVTPDIIDQRETWVLLSAEQRRVARVRAVHAFVVELMEHWDPLLAGRTHVTKSRARPRA